MKKFNQMTEKTMTKVDGGIPGGGITVAVGVVTALTAATAIPTGIAKTNKKF